MGRPTHEAPDSPTDVDPSSHKRQRFADDEPSQNSTLVVPIPMVALAANDNPQQQDLPTRDGELEAVCLKCFGNGVRRLFSIRLAYHGREAVVEQFVCSACGFYSSEILAMDLPDANMQDLSPDTAQPQSSVVSSKLSVTNSRDLERRIIKSRDGAMIFEEIEFEIPAVSQRGEVDTLGGFMRRAIQELSPHLRDENVTDHVRTAISTTVTQLVGYLEGNQPFTLRLDDAQGNSFIEYIQENDPAITLAFA